MNSLMTLAFPTLLASALLSPTPPPTQNVPPPAQVTATVPHEVTDIDRGTVTVDGYSSPARGVYIAPAEPKALIVVGHLRMPNCSDDTFAYPCPPGTEELRFDRGMAYLGEALAAEGYATLIPDLSVAYLEGDTEEPVNQAELVREIVAKLSDGLDFPRAGLVLHSRSGSMPDAIAAGLGKIPVEAVLAYGAVYPTPSTPLGFAADYLAIMGTLDHEAAHAANIWATEHLQVPHPRMMTVVSTPGFGHTYINRALSQRGKDDRIGCEELHCATAAEHERLLVDAARGFFAQRLVPPHEQILEVLPGEDVTRLGPRDFVGEKCVRLDAMDPTPVPNRCADPDVGAVVAEGEMVRVAPGREAVAHVEVPGARELAVHGVPVGPGGKLAVTVTFADGSTQRWEADPQGKFLRDRATEHQNGIYLVSTQRFELPAQDVVSVAVSASATPVEIRGVDIR